MAFYTKPVPNSIRKDSNSKIFILTYRHFAMEKQVFGRKEVWHLKIDQIITYFKHVLIDFVMK